MTNLCRTLGLASIVLAVGCGDSTADGSSESATDSASETSDSNSGNSDSNSSSESASDSNSGMTDSDSNSGDGDGDSGTDSDSASGDGDGDSGTDSDSASGDGDGDSGTDSDSAGDGDGDSGTDSDSDSDSAGDGDGDDPGTDTNGMPDFCAKVDFLFVIDNSISMLPEQEALKAAFPGFITAIEESLDTDDHILIADTDTIGWCTPGNCVGNNLHPTCEGPDSYACTMDLEECDVTLGAGVVEPAGQEASNASCDPFGDNRYILENDPDKDGSFSCMASVGLAGSPLERPLDAIAQALSDPLNGPGGCNEGFLRDDAILVITFISDDDGDEETLSPEQVYDAVVAAKNGDEDRIVTLGLIPSPNNNCSFTPGAGEHWLEFIDMFGPNGIDGPSCADDYVEFFQSAVDVIVNACAANPM